MNEPLISYLQDHLAGSVAAVDLLDLLRDQHKDDPLGPFAAALLAEIEEDRVVLQEVIQRAGGESSTLKEATAWLGEKVTRLKLSRTLSGELGTFEALEALALGILGKLELWRALAVAAVTDSRLRDFDFEHLAERARAQHGRVEEKRLETASTALHPTRRA